MSSDSEKSRKELIAELRTARTRLAELEAAIARTVSTEKYRDLIDKEKDIVYALDVEGLIIFASPATKEMLGYDPKEVLGEQFIELISEECREQARSDFQSVLATGEITAETMILDKNGQPHPVEYTSTAIEEGGRVVGTRGIVRDIAARKVDEAARQAAHDELERKVAERTEDLVQITLRLQTEVEERKRAEADLRLFQDLIDHSSDAVFVIDPETSGFLHVNDRACSSLGYEREELLSRGVIDVEAVFADPTSWRDHMREVQTQGHLIVEGRHKRKDGSSFPVEVNVAFVEQDDRQYMVAIVRDISERKQAEEALSRSRERLKAILDGAVDAIFMKDRQGRYVTINRACREMLGLPEEKIIGKTDFHLFPEENARHIKGVDDRVLRGETVEEEDTKPIGGEVHTFHMTKVPLYDEQGQVRGLCGIARDVSEQKQAEQALRKSEKILSEQNALLQEKNIALRELMEQLRDEKGRIEAQVMANVDRLLLPLIARLRGQVHEPQEAYVRLLEDNLKELTSSFAGHLSRRMLGLTQKEIEICDMIRSGLTSKEIASVMGVSFRTIETHRRNIRKKLGIDNKQVNLSTFLREMAKQPTA